MVSFQELRERLKDKFKFSRHEVLGLLSSIGFTAFIFSFRDWGTDNFNALTGVESLLLIIIIATISFVFRLACQKVYGLSQGYNVEFRVWWTGLFIMLAVCFISNGRIPLILIGGIVPAFMIKQRLGEFRYGFGYTETAVIAMWAVWAHLILAIFFTIGIILFPNTYLFEKGLLINLLAAGLSLLPLPQLDGLRIFFGSRGYFMVCVAAVILGSALLLTHTVVGITISIIIGLLAGGFFILIGSEK